MRFWGVRGSLAAPGKATSKVGGNTSCVEVRAGDEQIILDMGTGIRELGVAQRGQPMKATCLVSHYHFDHILGLPFFAPAYDPRSELLIYGATRQGRNVRAILSGQMIEPYFPVGLGEFRANLRFAAIESGSTASIGPVRVRTCELNHPGGALGYRLDYAGRSLTYCTDFEHGTEADQRLQDLARGTDILVFDAMYTPEEYAIFRGFGHSTWEVATQVARAAGVGRLYLFHHRPEHSDAEMEEIVRKARKLFPSTYASREGEVVDLAESMAVLKTARPRPPTRAAARRAAVRRKG